ncbi:HAD-IB family hydrolase [Mucilaginibacter sp. E4BP6]|jgi:HAD superfamily hydrolase (TIGR01490 family)|uniref:HAD-IB family hydrolase n=1 Tax=Mucilaginibacter sp. E4BP6 TaxID=2723089 RepID=UPI0015CA6516|nr:HAD-IB family hydrolase [Mucilaginibacter sp. E4BP6]NYE65140.1 HAD superfamily hydrolase (TIGR01490 family) [Mucilaginibacter sp. E4BP6]
MGEKISGTGRKVIAAFDFDGTIIKHDSLFVFIWYAVSLKRIILSTVKVMPYLVLYKLKVIPNFKAKEKLFTALFKGVTITDFNMLCKDFAVVIQKMVKPEALEKIEWHRQNGHEIIIISASVENWIIPWAKSNGIDAVLATQIEVSDGLITGKFLSKNCHGAEKVNRLLQHLPNRDSYVLYAYGDSNGDKDLLQFADHKFYRVFV